VDGVKPREDKQVRCEVVGLHEAVWVRCTVCAHAGATHRWRWRRAAGAGVCSCVYQCEGRAGQTGGRACEGQQQVSENIGATWVEGEGQA
jgi:hypothetical protein